MRANHKRVSVTDAAYEAATKCAEKRHSNLKAIATEAILQFTGELPHNQVHAIYIAAAMLVGIALGWLSGSIV